MFRVRTNPALLIAILFRQTNIALLQQYGSNAWRVHNYLLEANTTQMEKAVSDLEQLTTDVNRERKKMQVRRPYIAEVVLADLRSITDGAWSPADCTGDPMDRVDFQCAPNRDGECCIGGRTRSFNQKRGRAGCCMNVASTFSEQFECIVICIKYTDIRAWLRPASVICSGLSQSRRARQRRPDSLEGPHSNQIS